MRLAIFLLCLPLVTAPAAARDAQRQPIGIFFGWGAFEELSPRKCFAIAQAEPSSMKRQTRPFASVATWPRRDAASQLHLRLGQKKRPGSAVILRIDGRSYQLIGGGADAWAPNSAADAQIVAAMRIGVSMSVETRSERGSLVRDRYRLRGAATAIDAAAIACARG
jgi:hypothetical protein